MDIFYILNNLYTNKKSDWILELDEKELQENRCEPFLIQRWLAMNDNIRQQVRWLDKYVFKIPSKMYISLAWSIIPKFNKAPYVTYIKKKSKEDEYSFILDKVRKHLSLANNDYRANKERLLKLIEKDKILWFSFYGIPKQYWKIHLLDFNKIKEFGVTEKPVVNTGLGKWGLC